MSSSRSRTITTAVILCLLAAWQVIGSAEKVKLTFALWGNQETVDSKLVAVKMFERDYPDVEVQIQTSGFTEHHEKMVVQAAGGVAPDVFLVSIAYWPDLYRQGLIEPLNGYIDSDPDFNWNDYLYRNTVLFDDSIVGLPEHGGPLMLVYNSELFGKAGLETPDHLYNQGESAWNWERYIDIARRLTRDFNGDGTPDQYGSQRFSGSQIYRLLPSAGGETFSADRKTVFPNTQAAEKAMQFALDLVEREVAPPVGADVSAKGISFEAGTIAMQNMNAQPLFHAFHTQLYNVPWNMAPHPAGPAGFHNLVIVNPVVVSAQSKHKKLAWTLTKYLTGAEGQMEKIRQGYLVAPMLKSVLLSDSFQESNRALNLDLYYEAAVTNVHPYPAPLAGGTDPGRIISEEFNAVLSGEKPVTDAVQETKRKVDQVIAQKLTGE